MNDIVFMWSLKYDTNKVIYEIEKDSETKRTNF